MAKRSKHAIIIDFDNTLYYNPSHDFSSNIKEENILSEEYFFKRLCTKFPEIQYNHDYIFKRLYYLKYCEMFHCYYDKITSHILNTGRHISQQEKIITALERKGYTFDNVFFSTTDKELFPEFNQNVNQYDFLTSHYIAKLSNINQIRKGYKSIFLIDDDPFICHFAKLIRINAIKPILEQSILPNYLGIHSFYEDINGISLTFEKIYLNGFKKGVKNSKNNEERPSF